MYCLLLLFLCASAVAECPVIIRLNTIAGFGNQLRAIESAVQLAEIWKARVEVVNWKFLSHFEFHGDVVHAVRGNSPLPTGCDRFEQVGLAKFVQMAVDCDVKRPHSLFMKDLYSGTSFVRCMGNRGAYTYVPPAITRWLRAKPGAFADDAFSRQLAVRAAWMPPNTTRIAHEHGQGYKNIAPIVNGAAPMHLYDIGIHARTCVDCGWHWSWQSWQWNLHCLGAHLNCHNRTKDSPCAVKVYIATDNDEASDGLAAFVADCGHVPVRYNKHASVTGFAHSARVNGMHLDYALGDWMGLANSRVVMSSSTTYSQSAANYGNSLIVRMNHKDMSEMLCRPVLNIFPD